MIGILRKVAFGEPASAKFFCLRWIVRLIVFALPFPSSRRGATSRRAGTCSRGRCSAWFGPIAWMELDSGTDF
jgi:hypothetical protein